MAQGTEEATVAKRANDVSTKMDADALHQAKLAAEIKGITVAEFISTAVSEAAAKVLDDWAAARIDKGPRKPKGGKA